MFQDLGFSGQFKDKTQGPFPQLEYCVQYRETDFNFVSRLMEEYGIFYFFEHELSTHSLVLADATSAHQPCPNQDKATFDSTGRVLEEERITAFQIGQELKTGAYSMNDYNFETPLTDLDVSEPTVCTVANNATFELYDYPGVYTKKPDGEKVAKVRMQEQEASHMVGSGTSTCALFTPGYRFDLEEHYRRDLNKSYVLTELQHFANCGTSYYTGEPEGDETYTNEFVVIPYSVPYRPARNTPRAYCSRAADGRCRGSQRRRNLRRQVRPREGAVLLGPRRQERRKQLLLDARFRSFGLASNGAQSGPRGSGRK